VLSYHMRLHSLSSRDEYYYGTAWRQRAVDLWTKATTGLSHRPTYYRQLLA